MIALQTSMFLQMCVWLHHMILQKIFQRILIIILLLKVCGNTYFICDEIAVIISLFFVNLYKDLSKSVYISFLVQRGFEVETGLLSVAQSLCSSEGLIPDEKWESDFTERKPPHTTFKYLCGDTFTKWVEAFDSQRGHCSDSN